MCGSKQQNRCEFRSSAMGQSNAARDKLYDLRECPMANSDASDKDIAGAIMLRGDFTNTKFKAATMSKVYADEAKFDGADFTNAVMDRGSYKKLNPCEICFPVESAKWPFVHSTLEARGSGLS
jgi:hypothetical protein